VLGGFSGRFLTALTAELFGWRGGFLLLAAVTLLAAVALWRWLPTPPRRMPTARQPVLAGLFDHLRNPGVMATCAIGASVLFANVATFTYIDFRLARPPFSLGPAQLGLIFAVYLVGAIGTPASGRMIRSLGRRGALGLSVGLGSLGMVATLADWLPLIIVGLAFFASGIFMAQACSLGFLGQAARHAKSTAVGLYVCCYYIGGSLGAVVPGRLWDWGGWPACVGLVLATAAAATALAMWAWRPDAATN
jgi:predicted MFS family arabinose efflux permease